MTVVTNLVVALMIVTSGEETVKARVIHGQFQDEDPPWVVCASGPIETLYRKTCKTNFVYSADISVGCIRAFCQEPTCSDVKQFTIEEIFGKEVGMFGVKWDDPIFCKKHGKGKVDKWAK